jgi:hypothetical protein
MDLREIVCGVVDWMYLIQDRDQWRAVVNTGMNLQAPYGGGGICWLAEWLLASQDGLYSMKLVGPTYV